MCHLSDSFLFLFNPLILDATCAEAVTGTPGKICFSTY